MGVCSSNNAIHHTPPVPIVKYILYQPTTPPHRNYTDALSVPTFADAEVFPLSRRGSLSSAGSGGEVALPPSYAQLPLSRTNSTGSAGVPFLSIIRTDSAGSSTGGGGPRSPRGTGTPTVTLSRHNSTGSAGEFPELGNPSSGSALGGAIRYVPGGICLCVGIGIQHLFSSHMSPGT